MRIGGFVFLRTIDHGVHGEDSDKAKECWSCISCRTLWGQRSKTFRCRSSVSLLPGLYTARRTKGEHATLPEWMRAANACSVSMAVILASLHMQTADDLFGGPQGSPRTDKVIAASVQWAEEIMRKNDSARTIPAGTRT
jgi:hypothetical protein